MGNMEVTSGSSNDLQKATELAYSYVKKLGMMEKVSLICETEGVSVSPQYTYILDK
jgi:ATP-dependent Zn protease